MVAYQVSFQIKGDPSVTYSFRRDLLPHQEDNPQSFFTPKIRHEMRQELQPQISPYTLTENYLDWLIESWTEDIKIGSRDTRLGELDLPSANEENLRYIADQGYQEIPQLVSPNLEDTDPRIVMLPSLESLFN